MDTLFGLACSNIIRTRFSFFFVIQVSSDLLSLRMQVEQVSVLHRGTNYIALEHSHLIITLHTMVN